MTYYITNKGTVALDHSSAVDDIFEMESDEPDEIIDKVNRMRFTTFKKKYPTVYKKYYVDKYVKKTHITIEYSYPLISPIKKIYKNAKGFSINDIATIIRNQYMKFYEDHEAAEVNNTIPRYLPNNVNEFNSLCIRFWFDEKEKENENETPNILISVA